MRLGRVELLNQQALISRAACQRVHVPVCSTMSTGIEQRCSWAWNWEGKCKDKAKQPPSGTRLLATAGQSRLPLGGVSHTSYKSSSPQGMHGFQSTSSARAWYSSTPCPNQARKCDPIRSTQGPLSHRPLSLPLPGPISLLFPNFLLPLQTASANHP